MLGAMDGTTLAAHRVRTFLEREPVIWLSTSRPDGAPHLVPTWFACDGERIVMRSKPEVRIPARHSPDPRRAHGRVGARA
jgi:nitroimidazol reductase NimA-like FMN-containing flavoprotein (pyridoxamine 5'-phosphate oxidase superfamily)